MIHGGNVWQGDGPSAWLDFSANIRPDGAPEWVKKALMGAMDRLSYYPDPQMKRAKAALSEYLRLPEEYVLPTAGGISAIDLAARLGSEDMVQFTPCFAEYSMLSKNHGKQIGEISLLTERHEIGDPAELIRGRLHEGCTVWLCNPLNPVGVAFETEQVERLLAEVEKRRGWLVVDEAFIEYCPEKTATELIGKHERLLITGSMTKILGIPGVRLGYLCAAGSIIKKLAGFQITWELSCFAEEVLCALPDHRGEISGDARANARCRDQLAEGLNALGAYVYPSEAAFVLADFGRDMSGVIDSLKKRGILVRQCMNFAGIDDGHHLRLAVKDEISNGKLLRALKEEILCVENR